MNKKIDITSTALEKGIDIAKDFLEKLIMPSVEEVGLLMKDQVTFYKFKSQVRMLTKAKAYCEKNNISPKNISLKLLCPLLEYSGIEEDESLHDKWAILLSNLVDSEQNVENHVFPYILSQLSRNEFSLIEKVYDIKAEKVRTLKSELEEFLLTKDEKVKIVSNRVEEIAEILNDSQQTLDALTRSKLFEEKSKLESRRYHFKSHEGTLNFRMKQQEEIPYNSLKEYELSNLIRLGLIKEVREFYAESQTLEIPNNRDSFDSHTSLPIEIDVNSNTENVLTELGELFITSCKEKNDINRKSM